MIVGSPWQSRTRDATDYERRLAETLETILGESVHDLEGIVSALNVRGVQAPNNTPWTGETFCHEMKRLGAGNGLLWQPLATAETGSGGR